MRYFLYLFLPILCFSCSQEYTPLPQREKDIPAILGEIFPADTVSLTLTNAHNTTYPDYESNANFSNVVLLDEASQLLGKFYQQKNNRWKANCKTEAGKTYTLQFDWNEKKIQANTKIPSAFAAEILEKNSLSSDTLELKLFVENTFNPEKKGYYIVECWQYANEEYTKLSFSNDDEYTDNYKYRELHSPFKRLFFKTTQKQHFTIKISKDISSLHQKDEFIEIRIKSADTAYYNYLYNYELQRQNDEFYIPSTNNNYVGILGGCYIVRFRI